MKILILFCLSLSLAQAKVKPNLFQMMTSDPHIVEKISPFITTHELSGRLWIVSVNEKNNLPAKYYKYLKPVTGKEKSYIPQDIKVMALINNDVIKFTQLLSSIKIKASVTQLSSYKNRSAESLENKKAIDWVANEFKLLNYKISRECYKKDVCSVVADKESSNTSETILIEAHIDSVGKNFAGADDNASGTAVVLEMARVLAQYPNQKNIRFFITNGEELGLLGAKHYVDQLEMRSELQKLILVINMDMAGYNSNGIVELETNNEFEDLAKWFAEITKTYTKLTPKITLGAWGSDHVPFLEKGIPTLLTIEDWSTKTPCYHQECDKPDTLNYVYASEIAKINTAAVIIKDQE